MTVSYILLQGFKFAPFKYDYNAPYGSFINTTKAQEYVIKQQISLLNKNEPFVWPSSEHAYHAQKLIHLMQKFPQNIPLQQVIRTALRQLEKLKANPGEELNPRNDFDPFITNNLIPALQKIGIKPLSNLNDFNLLACMDAAGKGQNDRFMREVLQLKLDQHENLRRLAMECAREGIIPVEVSQYDSRWASGKNGNGENKLGLMILELGNHYLQNANPQATLPIPNPFATYQQIRNTPQHITALAHDHLLPYTKSMNAWTQAASQQPGHSPVNQSQRTTLISAINDSPFITNTAQNIQRILDELKQKINQTDPSNQGQPVAVCLLNDLEKAKDDYIANLKKPHANANNEGKRFLEQSTQLVDKARPQLEKHLDWRTYLTNMLRAFANVVILICTAGQVSNFFKPLQSELTNLAEEAQQKLTTLTSMSG